MGNENLEDPSGFLKHVERKISNHAKLPKEYISRLKEMSLGDEKASSLLAQYESFMKLAQLEPPSKPLSKQLVERIEWVEKNPKELGEYVGKWVAIANRQVAGYGDSPREATGMAIEKTGLLHGEFLVKYIHDIDYMTYALAI